jgi:hypothetical protein
LIELAGQFDFGKIIPARRSNLVTAPVYDINGRHNAKNKQ